MSNVKYNYYSCLVILETNRVPKFNYITMFQTIYICSNKTINDV